MEDDVLAAPYRLEYTYQRSTGPVIGRFLGALRDQRLEGVRTAAGAVMVPPLEYDADGNATGEPVAVGPGGVVTTWAWIEKPLRNHPLPRPFAWALVRLDGADTSMLHAIDAGSPAVMRTGMRVEPRWRDDRTGSIRDVECFVPTDAGPSIAALPAQPGEPIGVMPAPVRLDYTVTAGRNLSGYLRALAHRRIIGGRCPECHKVYLPQRGSCPTCGVQATAEVEVADRGTVTTFCIIRIPFEAAAFPPPYAAVSILLDGADMPIFHLLRGIALEDVRMGMRVRAVWVPDEELAPTLRSIRWFEPSDEPDAPFEQYERHL